MKIQWSFINHEKRGEKGGKKRQKVTKIRLYKLSKNYQKVFIIINTFEKIQLKQKAVCSKASVILGSLLAKHSHAQQNKQIHLIYSLCMKCIWTIDWSMVRQWWFKKNPKKTKKKPQIKSIINHITNITKTLQTVAHVKHTDNIIKWNKVKL